MHCISFFDVMTFSQNTEIRKTLNIFHLKIFGKSLLRSLNVLGYLMAFESFLKPQTSSQTFQRYAVHIYRYALHISFFPSKRCSRRLNSRSSLEVTEGNQFCVKKILSLPNYQIEVFLMSYRAQDLRRGTATPSVIP